MKIQLQWFPSGHNQNKKTTSYKITLAVQDSCFNAGTKDNKTYLSLNARCGRWSSMSSLSRGYYWGYRHLHSVWSLTFRRLVFLLCCLCSSLDFELPLGFNWNPDWKSHVSSWRKSLHGLCKFSPPLRSRSAQRRKQNITEEKYEIIDTWHPCFWSWQNNYHQKKSLSTFIYWMKPWTRQHFQALHELLRQLLYVCTSMKRLSTACTLINTGRNSPVITNLHTHKKLVCTRLSLQCK